MIMQDYNGSSKISTAQIIDAIGPVEGRVISIFEEKILADSNVNVLREPRTDKGWKYFLTFSGRRASGQIGTPARTRNLEPRFCRKIPETRQKALPSHA